MAAATHAATQTRLVPIAATGAVRAAASRRSRGIHNLAPGEDLVTTERVLQQPLLDEIDSAATEHRRQLVAHVHVALRRHRLSGLEADQNIDIAVRPEILPEHGAEQREFRDLPLPAEGFNLIDRNWD